MLLNQIKTIRTFLFFLATLILGIAKAQETQKIYLSGTDKDNTKLWDFYCTEGRNSGKQSKIAVPSCWELQGFGTYNYGKDRNKAKESGLYKYKFKVDKALAGKHINLVFDGVMTDAEVKLNGVLVGSKHQGAFYRFKYDVSKLLKLGANNVLEVKVDKVSSDTSVNRAERDADYWVFGGIFRPVWLEVLPEKHIKQISIDAKHNGAFRFKTEAKMDKSILGVRFVITNASGTLVYGNDVSFKGDSGAVWANAKVADVIPWSPENPYLYNLSVSLLDNKGQQGHTVKTKFGFRTAELRPGDGFYVNGVATKFKGICRHSFWPTSGRTLSKQLSILDVKLMKEMNMNAVRMSHYPPDEHFLEVCDSLGLYVLDELAGWQKRYDTLIGAKLLKEMVERDVNHPSIVIWDNGNEGGNNHAMVPLFAKYDPQGRLVIHPWAKFNGTDTQHYRGMGCCSGSLFHGKEVFFPTEYLHGLFDGGMGAGLADYWEEFYKNPLSAGGFLWVFSDEGVVRKDKKDSLDLSSDNAPDGIVGPYREKEASFYVAKEVFSPVKLSPKLVYGSFAGTLEIENRYQFRSTTEVKILRSLVMYHPFSKNIAERETAGLSVPVIKPGQKAAVDNYLPNYWSKFDLIEYKVVDYKGDTILSQAFPIQRAGQASEVQHLKMLQPSEGLSYTKEATTATVKGGKSEWKFELSTGKLLSFTEGGVESPLKNGPEMSIGTYSVKEVQWNNNTKTLTFVTDKWMKKLVWQFFSGGWLKLSYSCAANGDKYEGLGVSFTLPETEIKGIQYKGYGPYRVWKNRMDGNAFGYFYKKYNQTQTGFKGFEYPEFTGYHKGFYSGTLLLKTGQLDMVTASDDVFLRLGTPQYPETRNSKNVRPWFPKGDIGFMQAIPAIGDKFISAEDLSPSGAKNQFFNDRDPMTWGADVWFRFVPNSKP